MPATTSALPSANPIVGVVRKTGIERPTPTTGWSRKGIEELADKLDEHRAYIDAEGTLVERRRRNLMNEVLAIATYRMRRELEASVREDPEVRELLDRVVSRELDPASAATTILEARVAAGGA